VPTVEQHYLHVLEGKKLDVLTHLLETEAEPGEAALIFTRTKARAADLAERLQARGYTAEALNGDMNQTQREDVLRRLRGGQVDLVVATDIAARGLDVARISSLIMTSQMIRRPISPASGALPGPGVRVKGFCW
jgi:ATP-dependent RNA helicase DeaD